MNYLIIISQVRTWLENGTISYEEYCEIESIIAKKYGLNSSNIYRDKDLINGKNCGNMVVREEDTNGSI